MQTERKSSNISFRLHNGLFSNSVSEKNYEINTRNKSRTFTDAIFPVVVVCFFVVVVVLCLGVVCALCVLSLFWNLGACASSRSLLSGYFPS